jgi:hypothetical protein
VQYHDDEKRPWHVSEALRTLDSDLVRVSLSNSYKPFRETYFSSPGQGAEISPYTSEAAEKKPGSQPRHAYEKEQRKLPRDPMTDELNAKLTKPVLLSETCVLASEIRSRDERPKPLAAFDPVFDWGEGKAAELCERRDAPPPAANTEKFHMHVIAKSLQCATNDIEPVFCTLAVYDVELGVKLSENFTFALNSPKVDGWLKPHAHTVVAMHSSAQPLILSPLGVDGEAARGGGGPLRASRVLAARQRQQEAAQQRRLPRAAVPQSAAGRAEFV